MILALPVPEDPQWRGIWAQNVDQVRTVMLFLPGVLMLFACVKMLVNGCHLFIIKNAVAPAKNRVLGRQKRNI